MSGTGTDVFFFPDSNEVSPTVAHNAMKKFLFDDFRFRTTFEIYAFLKPLSSAHTGNNSWVSDPTNRTKYANQLPMFPVVRGGSGIYTTSDPDSIIF